MIVAVGSFTGLQAQEVSARASVDSTTYSVGDPIRVTVDMAHPRGVTLTPLFADTVGDFMVLDGRTVRSNDDTSSSAQVVVARYDSGFAVLPPLKYAYVLPGGTTTDTVETNPLLLTVHLVEIDTTGSIRDLKPPLGVPLTLTEVATIVLIALAVVATVYFLRRYWKRRRTLKPESADVSPPRPAHIIALEELALLKEKRLWQQGLTKQYYSELTEILRRYFENRYGMTALEETTDEIMHDLRSHLHAESLCGDAGRILRQADLVKFAKFLPPISEHEESLITAYNLVDKTKRIETVERKEVHELVGS